MQPAVPENPAPVVQTEAPVIVANEKTAVDTGLSILSKAHRGLRQTEQVQIKTTSTHALSVVCFCLIFGLRIDMLFDHCSYFSWCLSMTMSDVTYQVKKNIYICQSNGLAYRYVHFTVLESFL